MIVMQHEIRFQLQEEEEQETSVGLVVYGDPDGHSAMAKTVGYPVGIVAQMILKGEWSCALKNVIAYALVMHLVSTALLSCV